MVSFPSEQGGFLFTADGSGITGITCRSDVEVSESMLVPESE